MVDPGDNVSNTLKKEFGEEALNSMELSQQEREKLHDSLQEVFTHGDEVRFVDMMWFFAVDGKTYRIYWLTCCNNIQLNLSFLTWLSWNPCYFEVKLSFPFVWPSLGANVSVNSNCGHSPPGQTPGIWFFGKFRSNARLCGQNSWSNALPVGLTTSVKRRHDSREFIVFTLCGLCGAELESTTVGIDRYITWLFWNPTISNYFSCPVGFDWHVKFWLLLWAREVFCVTISK